MRFSNEFSVALPVDVVWSVLLDVERVAGYFPGATVAPAEGQTGTYRGAMRLKLGPVVARYGGNLRIEEVDQDTRVAVLAVEAAELGGQGAARATITNRLRPTDDGTFVEVETELDVTGRHAQLGHAIMERVADRMLADFARRFEADLGVAEAPAGPAALDDALDLGATVMVPARVERALLVTLSVAVVAMAVRVTRRYVL